MLGFCYCGLVSLVGGRFASVERGSGSVEVKVLLVVVLFRRRYIFFWLFWVIGVLVDLLFLRYR